MRPGGWRGKYKAGGDRGEIFLSRMEGKIQVLACGREDTIGRDGGTELKENERGGG